MPSAIIVAVIAAGVSFALSPVAAWCAVRLGMVSLPLSDRWHRSPTPLLGGVAIAAATSVAAIVFGLGGWSAPAVLGCSVGALAIGLIDDRFKLTPTGKLVGTLAAGAVLVYLLGQSASRVPSAPVVILGVVWFAAIAHAVNLLDNIDGLAAGVGAVTALGTAVVLRECGATDAGLMLVGLAGALLGFLPWNTHPARLFMGDGGSLFVGSMLAGCSLVPWFGSRPGNVLWPLALTIALIVPLGEAAFVSALRWMAGRKASRGGTDHSSHRLVAIGFSQRRSVLFLDLVAIVAAVVAVWIARSGTAALPGVALLIVGLGLGAIYLAHVPTYQGDDFAALLRAPFGTALRSALFRSHAPQVLLDLVLITASYYAAYRIRFEGEALDIFLPSFAVSLPVVIVCKLAAHYASGLYRRSWLTFGVSDIPAVARAIVAGTTASVLSVTYLYRFERFSRGVFIIDAALLLLAVLTTRLSFRLMAYTVTVQSSRARRVLICGARDRGQLLAREMLVNVDWSLKPVGYVDTLAPSDHWILGIRVYRASDDLRDLVRRLRIDEVVFSGDELESTELQTARRVCAELGIPIRELVFELRQPVSDASGSSAA